MKLNLTQAQINKARKGQPFQVKVEQMGSGMSFDFNPTNLKKLAKAGMLGKGVRLTLSGDELGEMDGGKFSFNKGLKKLGVKKAVNQNVSRATKAVNQNVNRVSKAAKKHLTEKNVAKYSLKGYNAINNQLEKQGMPSIHQAVLNEGLNYVPFVPSAVKDVASHYATKYADRALAKESERIGAGVNPYMPKALVGGKFSFNKGLKKLGVKKAVNQNVKKARKAVNQNVNRASKAVKKHVTPKNVAKYSLKGYNAINRQLEKQGMPSIHQAVLNEGLNYVPFVPSSVKDVASHYATKYADRALAKESERIGAGFRRAKPGFKMAGGSVKVFDDNYNILRPGQAGFIGLSDAQATLLTSGKKADGRSVQNDFKSVSGIRNKAISDAQANKLTGGSFTMGRYHGGSFRNP